MEELKKLQLDDLSQFTIKGSETEWSSALSKNPKGIVSLKRYYFIYVMWEYVIHFVFLYSSGEKRRLLDVDEEKVEEDAKPERKKNHNKNQRGKKKAKK